MENTFVDNFNLGNAPQKPSKKKPMFTVGAALRHYLKQQGREVKLPVSYKDLTHYSHSIPLKNKNGENTLWETVSYDKNLWDFLREGLVHIYAILRTEGDLSFANHLDVSRIDVCHFANSNPFRIRIVNKFNDNYDHYYIKIADANRVYGLELEHILSPNRMVYFTDKNTLVEEHIAGIPGDDFIEKNLRDPATNKIRLAKEFVKFNERCFARLLGDMQSYNYVVDVTPDFEDSQYRIRTIDFDQQSYEGRKNLYLPQFFKNNNALVQLTLKHLNKESIEQYQTEERTLMALRLSAARYRIRDLLDIMGNDNISSAEKTAQLAFELAEYHKNKSFLRCKTMGQLVKRNMKQVFQKQLKLVPKFSNGD